MFSKLLSLLVVLSFAAVSFLVFGANDFSLSRLGTNLGGNLDRVLPGRTAFIAPNVNSGGMPCVSEDSGAGRLPPHGVCPTTLPISNPVEVTEDNTVVENLDINSPDHSKCGILIVNRENVTVRNININHAGAGICVFDSKNIKIELARVVNTISVPGPHCKPGLSVQQCKLVHRKSNPEKLYPVNSHNNIWLARSENVSIDTVYLEKGESGIFSNRVSGLTIENFYCRDIRGPFWRGQCVQAFRSDGAKISRFYVKQFLETSSGHDNINAFDSSNVIVSDGLIDGNWSRNGVGVIADKSAHNMTIKDVDILNNGTAGVSVWSGNADKSTVGREFHVENVNVKDGHCDISWHNLPDFGPSSDGLAFAMHPEAQGARFRRSSYWNHCRNYAVYINGNPDEVDITERDFAAKAPPIEINFPWL